MVQNTVKETIAISLFTGAILAIFVFIGNLAKDFIFQKSNFIFGLIFSIEFLILICLSIYISLKVLLNPSIDLHIIGDIFR